MFERKIPPNSLCKCYSLCKEDPSHPKVYRTNHRSNLRLIMSYYEDSLWIIDGGASEKFYSRNFYVI